MKENISKNRMGFNFLRSYYDVLNELNTDKEKLQFLMAILQKQFDGVEPNIEGIVKLCYVGQKHSIDKSRKGWEDKVGYESPTLTIDPTHRIDPTEDPYHRVGLETENDTNSSIFTTKYPTHRVDPTEDPTHRIDPYQQEQEQEQVKEEEEVKEQVQELEQKKKKFRKEFYDENKSTIHHIIDLTNCSLEDAITLEIENQESISSVFG